MPRKVLPLTDVQIRNAKPKEKSFKLSDGDGLYLEVLPTGGKSWRMKYFFGGTERRLVFGLWPDVPLKQARQFRENARSLLAEGMDPGVKRKRDKAEAIAETENTFEKIAREWLARMSLSWAPTLWDAFHSSKACTAFALLALMTTADSLQAEGAAWASRLVMFLEERKEEKADEAKLDKYLALYQEAERKRVAWMLALEALDNETGAACIPMVDTFANGHAGRVLEDAKGQEICFAEELEYLRDAWGKLTAFIAGAPKLEEASPQAAQ